MAVEVLLDCQRSTIALQFLYAALAFFLVIELMAEYASYRRLEGTHGILGIAHQQSNGEIVRCTELRPVKTESAGFIQVNEHKPPLSVLSEHSLSPDFTPN